jgi:hypothetical protein
MNEAEFERFAAEIGKPNVSTGAVQSADGNIVVTHDAVHTGRVKMGIHRMTTRGGQWMWIELTETQATELITVLQRGVDQVRHHQQPEKTTQESERANRTWTAEERAEVYRNDHSLTNTIRYPVGYRFYYPGYGICEVFSHHRDENIACTVVIPGGQLARMLYYGIDVHGIPVDRECNVSWGSHGCHLSYGHHLSSDDNQYCRCDCANPDEEGNVGAFPYYGAITRLRGSDVPEVWGIPETTQISNSPRFQEEQT